MPNIGPEVRDMRHIHVVAGIIYNPARDHVLIARRPEHLHQGGLWEFPGGKVEGDEAALEALRRELAEELAIDIHSHTAEIFSQIHHQYPDKGVFLEFWQVFGYSGEARGREGQQLSWVPVSGLDAYPFPAANVPVVRQLLAGRP
jgi:8-oxo-dGTP diphosphatase